MGVSMQVAAIKATDLNYQLAFETHWQDVFRFSLAWTNDWASAEDLTQEAFLRLWRNRLALDWSRPVLPWLLVAARRLATDRFRTFRRRITAPKVDRTPEESVIDRWLDVQASMAALSALERSALILTMLDGVSYADAADALGKTQGSLRAAVARARVKLEAK